MAVYFWYAERDEKSPVHPHLNQASGLVEADDLNDAWDMVSADARDNLGNTKRFTVTQFNKVGE